ncbi:MAG: hypothetical protein DI556_08060 [Rhodovulum sulfidophilum]|uniref:Uncharacterized protein n=1 Tax=Rhodovulum sulfidophilum TaxID=35806 RepID=A0A2W5NI76_RHOSU|nr:MAG: hypothetical protein DI556_08060 [Rhodovulum sulfidophilum]
MRVLPRGGDPGGNGTTLRPGTLTLSTAAERQNRPPSDPQGLRMGSPGAWNNSPAGRAGFQALIPRELGHVLGFGHEQDRPDGDEGGACHGDGFPDSIRIGPPDPESAR